jgi:hypothetical protein
MDTIIGFVTGVIAAILAVALSHPNGAGEAGQIGGAAAVGGFTVGYFTSMLVRNISQKGKTTSARGVSLTAGAAPVAAGLTQWQRVAYTFTAPSKTFEDIRRGNRSWWLPLIVGALASFILFGAVVEKVGMRQTVENQIRMNPKAEEGMSQLPPDQKEKAYARATGISEFMFLAGPVLGMLGTLVIAGVLMGTINFGFGGRAKFGDVFAVVYYAWLPLVVKVLLGVVVIYAGIAPESFNIQNYAPTNLAALFMDPVESNKILYALATSLDAVNVWMVVLMSIGVATVAGVKRSAGYIAAIGWWAIIVLFGVGMAAVRAAIGA